MRVLVFGTFDPLHRGHGYFLRHARRLGQQLVVVVTCDSAIRMQKHREPFQAERERLARVVALPWVDEAFLGDEQPSNYELLKRLTFDILALGYDQEPTDEVVRRELAAQGKQYVKVVRLGSYKPERYKSSYLRGHTAHDCEFYLF